MTDKELEVAADQLRGIIGKCSASELCLLLDRVSDEPNFMPAVTGVIWHIGQQLDAAYAKIYPGRNSIKLDFVAKKGKSLDFSKIKH